MLHKKQFKVITPVDKKGGGKWWMRCGSAYVNRDNSINCYVESLPVGTVGALTLQLRELTEEEIREQMAKRATYASRGGAGTDSSFGSDGGSRFGSGSDGGSRFGGGGSGGGWRGGAATRDDDWRTSGLASSASDGPPFDDALGAAKPAEDQVPF